MALRHKVRNRADAWRALAQDIGMGVRMASRLPALLRRPLDFEAARALAAERLRTRADTFLDLARRAIYEVAGNPYRALLDSAGCEYGDLESLVGSEGLEGALRTLFDAGVYLTVDEFKGREPVRRGSTVLEVDPPSTQNPLARKHVLSRTSGSRSARTVVAFDLAFIRDCAVSHCVGLGVRGGEDWVRAAWEGPGGGATFRIVKFSCQGSPPARLFFRADPAKQSPATRWTDRLMRWGHRLAGMPLPPASYVPHDEPLPIARWMEAVLRSGRAPYLFGFVSSHVRLCQEADAAGVDLAGAVFHMGGEPITRARRDVVESVGAEAIPRYGSVETGMIGYACLEPEHADDLHQLHDLYAIIQPGAGEAAGRREGDARGLEGRSRGDGAPGLEGIPGRALFVTSLRPTAPFVLVNVCMGDQASIARRTCGCPMEALGWTTHLHTVRSYEKLTTAGVTLWDTDVIRVLEESLPGRFGGGPTSYQLVEYEVDARPRLKLRVDPAVGPVEEEDVRRAFLDGIHATGNRLWEAPGFLGVTRESPGATGSGKILHLDVERGAGGVTPSGGS